MRKRRDPQRSAAARADAVRMYVAHADPVLRGAAVWRAQQLPAGEQAAVVRAALQDDNRTVRQAARRHLALLPQEERGPALRAAIRETDLGALRQLEVVSAAERGRTLRVALEEPLAFMRPSVIVAALGYIGLLPAEEQGALLKPLLHDDDDRIRAAALGQVRVLPVTERVEAVRAALSDPSTMVQQAAVEQVGLLPKAERATAIRTALTRHTLRGPALKQLGLLPRGERFEALRTILRDADEWVRAEAVRHLHLLSAPQQADQLRVALRDVSLAVRQAAVAQVRLLPEDERSATLRATLHDLSPYLRAAAVAQVHLLPMRERVRAIHQALRDGEWVVRSVARERLDRLSEAERLAAMGDLPAIHAPMRRCVWQNRWEPYTQPARHVDAPVSETEIRAVLRLAEEGWHRPGPEGDKPRTGILVLRYPPIDRAQLRLLSPGPILAAWVVDASGTRAITPEEARQLNGGKTSDGMGFDPAVILFAPLKGTNHLEIGHLYGPTMGHGDIVEVGRRGGMRFVERLWIS